MHPYGARNHRLEGPGAEEQHAACSLVLRLGWLRVEPESQSLAEPAMPMGSTLFSHPTAKGLQGPHLEVSSKPFSPAWGPRHGDAVKPKRFARENPIQETGH